MKGDKERLLGREERKEGGREEENLKGLGGIEDRGRERTEGGKR
jgi:hypothetical protein